MGFLSVKTAQGIETIKRQVELVPQTSDLKIVNRTVLIPDQRPGYIPDGLSMSTAYYLDKNISGDATRIPGETLSRVYMAQVCNRRMIMEAVVLVPLDTQAHNVVSLAVDMSDLSQTSLSDSDNYCKTAIALAVMAVADGNYLDTAVVTQKV